MYRSAARVARGLFGAFLAIFPALSVAPATSKAVAQLRCTKDIGVPSGTGAFGGAATWLCQKFISTRDIVAFLLVSAGFYFVALGMPAGASLVTATITGTVQSGIDQGSNGIGVFGPASSAGISLAGRSFTLVFTFDDTKGQQSIYGTPPYFSEIYGSGSSSPGTAVLTIGGASVQYPKPTDISNSYSSAAYRDVYGQKVSFFVGSLYSTVEINLSPESGRMFNDNYDRKNSFSYTYVNGDSNIGDVLQFNYAVYYNNNPYNFASASGRAGGYVHQ